MLDDQPVSAPTIPRIEVEDYIEMGRLVAEWAIDPAGRPADIGALRGQLAGIAALPDRLRSMEFVQGSLKHLVIRLPARPLVEEALARMSDPLGSPRYRIPQFYADHCRPRFGPVMTPLDMLFARIGDQTIVQCR
ncbi:hypothetical protein [Amaricoccus sp.]|uniref:hypothetical protein n=1 Tax=Amaricoccus sp. TaxID=1872485 RepID=UPI00260A8EE8|nr:hypothetical protein [Amaricoccus sp.]HRO10817.1 hypothetical protein [Amaricoccus sp.]